MKGFSTKTIIDAKTLMANDIRTKVSFDINCTNDINILVLNPVSGIDDCLKDNKPAWNILVISNVSLLEAPLTESKSTGFFSSQGRLLEAVLIMKHGEKVEQKRFPLYPRPGQKLDLQGITIRSIGIGSNESLSFTSYKALQMIIAKRLNFTLETTALPSSVSYGVTPVNGNWSDVNAFEGNRIKMQIT